MSYERWNISPELEIKMRDVARQLRQEATPTEAILWEKLRAKQLGYKFKRQAPIGPFIVDFLCADARLVVEVDGPIHAMQQEADHDRQSLIETLGIRFIRVSTDDVENHLFEVVDRIRICLNEQPAISSPHQQNLD
jgi:very-short-patch-repair endonuclease